MSSRISRITVVALVALGLPIVAIPLAAGPADLDPTFDGDGVVTTAVRGFDSVTGITQQADAKLVVTGPSTPFVSTGTPSGAALARYNPDGSLDTSYGGTGIVTTQLGPPGTAGATLDIARQADGKMVVAGWTESGGADTDLVVARYTTGGTLDPTFGAGGLVFLDIGGGSERGAAVVIQPDGRIVVAGTLTAGGDPTVIVVRFLSSGAVDSTFGNLAGVGTAVVETGGFSGVNDVALKPGGEIVVAGFVGSADRDAILVQLDTTGTPDGAFGAGGIVRFDSLGDSELFRDIEIQVDGRIYAVGSSSKGGGALLFLRYSASGVPELGPIYANVGTFTFGTGVVVLPDGRVVLAGVTYNGSNRDIVLFRFTASGAPDTAFASGSFFRIVDLGSDEQAFAMLQQTDSKLVVGGDGDSGGGLKKFLVARFGTSPPPPKVTDDFGDAPDTYSTTLGAGGARHTGTGPFLGVARDLEANAATPLDGTGDDATGLDDEDGVVFPSLVPGGGVELSVTASGAAKLDGFVDFDGNGTFDLPGEQIFASAAVVAGVNVLTTVVPASAVSGKSFARLRLSTAGGLGPAGPAADGEVEDYAITISPAPSGGGGIGGGGGAPGGGATNARPVFDRDPCDLVASFSVWGRSDVTLTASDPDSGQTLTITVDSAPWWLQVDSTSGNPATVRFTANAGLLDWLISLFVPTRPIMVTVTDNGVPPASVTCSVTPRIQLFALS